MARKLELEVEPEAVTEFLGPHGGTLTDSELFLMDEQWKWRRNPCLVQVLWRVLSDNRHL